MLAEPSEDISIADGTLLILTKHFPYNDGNTPAEAYLETEIGFIASRFTSVIVVATEAHVSSSRIQETPDNVRSFALGFLQSRREKALCLAKGLCGSKGMPEATIAVDSDGKLTPSQYLFQRYYIGKALRKWSALIELLNRESIRPAYIYSFWFHDTALIACWLKREFGSERAVARAHRYDLYHDRAGCGLLPCREYQLRVLDAVLPCSEDGTNYLKQLYPSVSEKIKTGYLGTRWLPDKSDEKRGSVFRLVSCSAVTPVKRVLMLAEALGILDSSGIELEWTHYGDGPEISSVKNAVKGFRMVHCCFAGNLPNTKLLDEYDRNHYDLFVNVSRSEGLPISIMEASGHGIPVMATDVGGTHEIVEDETSGKLVPEQCDAKLVASTIMSFVEMNDDDYALMRIAARMRWQTKFQTKDNVFVLLGELLPSLKSYGGKPSEW